MRNRFRICMIILILSGVLLGGIGTGIALAEFSELEYTESVLTGSAEDTTIIKYELSHEKTDYIYCYTYWNAKEEEVITENRKIPVDEIWFEVTYDPNYVEPLAETIGVYENAESCIEEIQLWTIRKSRDELKELWELKDQILSDLKERKISFYEYAPVIRVEVQVNPANTEKVIIRK